MQEEATIIAGGEFRLFGVLHHPTASGRADVGALLLPPFAEEKKGAHRLLVDLARELCRRGVPTLRFDYRGTGDSEGTFTDFTLSGALADARRAIAFLRERASTDRVGLVGVRLGGTLAAHLARETETRAAWLALWEPITSGRRYVQMNLRQMRIREMMTAAEGSRTGSVGVWEYGGMGVTGSGGAIPKTDEPIRGRPIPHTPTPPHSHTPTLPYSHTPTPPREGYDFDGYWITPALHAELGALTLPTPRDEGGPPRVLAIAVNAAARVSSELEALASTYGSAGASVAAIAVAAEPFWSLQDTVPVPKLIRATADWVVPRNSPLAG
ncbi:MAG: alpha/beta hydrolase [Armatimonadetes bacterium]|nr:alpha/beta hydrolase [Armatimonadota bacterium]